MNTKNAFEPPLRHRFTFVPEGWSYFDGYTVQISAQITSMKKAFAIACERFLQQYGDKPMLAVAVFYGNVESPDTEDKLLQAYTQFHKKKLKRVKFRGIRK